MKTVHDFLYADLPRLFVTKYQNDVAENPHRFPEFFEKTLAKLRTSILIAARRKVLIDPPPDKMMAEDAVLLTYRKSVGSLYPGLPLPRGLKARLGQKVLKIFSAEKLVARQRKSKFLAALDDGVRNLGPYCTDEQLIQWMFMYFDGDYPPYFLGKPEVVQTWINNRTTKKRFGQDASNARTGR